MSNEQENMGYLRVAVTTAEGVIPVANARVTIRAQDGTETVLMTDESGLTTLLALQAPPAAASQNAFGKDPFASYSVAVEKEGFYKQTTAFVPIFAGITARQPINLIGLAEYIGESFVPTDSTDTVLTDPQVLSNGKERS